MKNNLIFNGLIIALISAILPICSPAKAQMDQEIIQSSAPDAGEEQSLSLPSPEVLTVLVQATLGTLNDANLTGDYSVLLKRGSASFQSVNSADSLSRGFAQFRDSKVDLAPSVLYPIRWTETPLLTGQTMSLFGAVSSRPQEIVFEFGYEIEGGAWRLAAISVGLSNPIE